MSGDRAVSNSRETDNGKTHPASGRALSEHYRPGRTEAARRCRWHSGDLISPYTVRGYRSKASDDDDDDDGVEEHSEEEKP